jgi:drug/metabolite transporter (DMT)-like permease
MLAIGSAFFLSISRVIEKKVLNAEHALEFSTSSGIFRIILLLVIAPFIDFSMLSIQGYIFIYFVSIIGVFAFLFRAKATRHMNISDVDPLFNLQPLFLVILSYAFLQETLNLVQFGGVLLLLAGTYILEIEEESKTFFDPIRKFLKSRYMHYMIFTILAFTFTSIFDKIVIRDIVKGEPLTYLFLFYIFLGINFLFFDILRFGCKDVAISITTKPVATFLAMFLHLVNIFFYFTALAIPGVLVSLVIPIRRMSSLFSTIIGGKVYHETHMLQKFLASIVMIAGATVIIVFT